MLKGGEALQGCPQTQEKPSRREKPPLGAPAELQTQGASAAGPSLSRRPQWKASGLPPPESRCKPAGERRWQGQLPSPGATQPRPEAGGWPRWPRTHSPVQEAEAWHGQHRLEVLLLEWGPFQLTPETARASGKGRVIGPGQSNHLVTRPE